MKNNNSIPAKASTVLNKYIILFLLACLQILKSWLQEEKVSYEVNFSVWLEHIS